VDRVLGCGHNEPSIGDLHHLRDVVELGLLDGPESPAGRPPFFGVGAEMLSPSESEAWRQWRRCVRELLWRAAGRVGVVQDSVVSAPRLDVGEQHDDEASLSTWVRTKPTAGRLHHFRSAGAVAETPVRRNTPPGTIGQRYRAA
jgi:hypothetical protein